MEPRRRPVIKPPSVPATASPKVRIGFVRSADDVLRTLPEPVQRGLREKIKAHVLNPRLGKPLVGELQGCCRVTYGRVRCIVRMAEGIAVGLVIAVGSRKSGDKGDPYALALDYMKNHPEEAQEILARHIRAFMESMKPGEIPQDTPAKVQKRRK